MALNPTSVLRSIKRRLGASHFPLPLDDEEIMDIIEQETLYTYSTYFPHQFPINVDTKNDLVPGEVGKYFLDSSDVEILSVAKVFRGSGVHTHSNYPYMRVNTQSAATMQMISDLSSFSEVPETFMFIAPNMIEVFPKIVNEANFMVTVNCIHPSNLGTIPISMREEFLKLALYDVQISLYQILKHYEGLGTAVGNISLKTEELEAADANRRELLEKWDTMYFKEPIRKKIWIV